MSDTPPSDELLVERDGNGVVTVTLNRPQVKNAFPNYLWPRFKEIIDEVRRNPTDRVLVITGAGGMFCAGGDIGKTDGRPQHPMEIMSEGSAAAISLFGLEKPTIAKVRGDAVGVGMNLALSCDLVVAGQGARFSEIFVKRGLAPDFGGTWLLPQLVGIQKAKELAFFGEIISAEDAAGLGLVNHVVVDDELDGFVDDWASRLAAGPPLALQMTKRMISNAATSTLMDALSAEAYAQTVALSSKDAREGFKAFHERRTPEFEGR